MTLRTAVVQLRDGVPNAFTVAAYLPANYKITDVFEDRLVITGEDNAGWTLDGYVIPRLASGLIHAREISPEG